MPFAKPISSVSNLPKLSAEVPITPKGRVAPVITPTSVHFSEISLLPYLALDAPRHIL